MFMEIKSFNDAHEVLKSFIPRSQERGAYTLDRMQRLMEYLGNPQNTYTVIHVAGTSGKTSTSYYMASLLHATGSKVGLAVSPHVDEINERVQINLRPLPEQKFCRQLQKFIKLVEATKIKPTYFELIVAFAYWQFAQDKVDYAVIEVGLGGLLDGTNVVSTNDKICVITDIGLDHTEILGKTLPEIAAQKAGIIRPYNSVFMYEQGTEVLNVVREVCEAQSAELHEIMPMKSAELPTNLPLFQRRNWYLAFCVYEYIADRDGVGKLSEQQLAITTEIKIPARMETLVFRDKVVIMDGAHNAQKLQTLFKSIKNQYPRHEIAALISLKQTKGIRTQTSLEVIVKHVSWLGITSFNSEDDAPYKSVEPAKLAERCHMMGFDRWEIIDDPKQAFTEFLKRPEPILLATGSFYLLNHIRPIVKQLSS
jgi:dihydrofolate synthase / folylpolyglutamate synthase